MEFVVSKANLQSQLLLAQGIVERKTTLPILSHILLRATAEGIDLVATDLEVGLQGRCDAVVAAPGEVSVQARKLLEIVRSLPEAEIQVRRSGDDLNIQCERSRFRLRGLPAAEFPKLPDTAVRQPVVLRAADLRDMIGKVLFAVTVDDPVYSLNGALLQMEGQTLTLVATDGHRLAYRWFHYAEAGFVPGQSLARVSLSGTNAPVTTVTVTEACRPAWQPSKAPCPRSSAHLVLEVTDSGVPALTSYRRVILNVDANRP